MGGWGRAGAGCLMVLIAIGLLLLVPLANRHPGSGVTSSPSTPTRAASPTPAQLTVRYYIHGTPNDFHAQISYVEQGASIQQVPDYQGAWDKVLTMQSGQLAQITVRELQPGTADQTIVCEIQIDGKPWRTQQGQGAGAQATCQGVVGEP